MNTTLVPLFKKFSLLLAVLLCSVLTFVVPAMSEAAPAPAKPIAQEVSASDDVPFSIVAGEFSAGEAEGVLQPHEKTVWSPLIKAILQLLYPQSIVTEAIPGNHPHHLGSRLLHSILTKGP
ncbi:hypothetical protein ACFS7Z_11550 [Pontibacter toksunensis]|uniref:Uncharacterized protein n=1 Tax=Pontibacter toksunensis TaxID=1332631 RepID=A0ABW6BUN7_9BACT